MGDLSPAMVEALRQLQNPNEHAEVIGRAREGEGWVMRGLTDIGGSTAWALEERGLVDSRAKSHGMGAGVYGFLRLTDKGREVLASLEENSDG